jgi:23S rRNA pseudouridine2604 synthase
MTKLAGQRRSAQDGQPAAAAMPPTPCVRLSKRMAELGLCSRREADAWIERGWVAVEGRPVAELGVKVRADLPAAAIAIAPAARGEQRARLTVLLNKPVGYVSGQAEDGYRPAATLIVPPRLWAGARGGAAPAAWGGLRRSDLGALAPAGRLDIDSTGLLVLTQDGRIARQLIGDDSNVEKEYLVRVALHERPTSEPRAWVDAAALRLLRHGLSLDGVRLKPAQVEWQNASQLRFVLTEGRKRQIRRMCELVGLQVLALKRVRIGAVRLGALPLGQWRPLGPDEHF